MVKSNSFGEHQNYINLIPQYLKENPDIIIVAEKSTPIILEEEVTHDMPSVDKISYDLPQSIETSFSNIILYIAPKIKISDIRELLEFKKSVLNNEFPDYCMGRDLKIKDNTIDFPASFYSENVGILSIVAPNIKVTLNDRDGKELFLKYFDKDSKPYTRNVAINASVAVLVFPNYDIAEAIFNGTLEYHFLQETREHGYLRKELEKYEPSLGPKKGLIKGLLNKIL